MPSRLKSFELHGYKTFPSRTEFIFADGITAIVGPNGSGKSNIADALRWVLGEQSFGLLRAKKTEDMIFAGSENRPRAGMASATIIFDNSDGWLPIDFSEVGITRRAYRDGDNEYLLNGQRVRLKDVSELLAQSGLAERTYTVIGQGLVDAALSLKAEERRRLFEEAAGISLHRARRSEALRRLDTTQRNLDRIQDILAELQPRVKSLERQSRRTQEYEQVRTDLKVLLREWYGYHWHQAQAELIDARDVAQRQESNLQKVRSEQVRLDQKLTATRNQSMEFRNQISDWNHKIADEYVQREKITSELAVMEERARSLENQIKDGDIEIQRLQEDLIFFQEQIIFADEELDRLNRDKKDNQANLADISREFELRQGQYDEAWKELQQTQKDFSDLNTQLSVLKTQLKERKLTRDLRLKEFEEIITKTQQLEDDLEDYQLALTKAIEQQQKVNEALIGVEAATRSVRLEISKLETSRRDIVDKKDTVNALLTQYQAQLKVLRQAEDTLSGYAEGARVLLQALRDSQISGARGSLMNVLEVPGEYEVAITSALGEYVGMMLVNDWDGVDESLNILEHSSARGALFIMAALRSQRHLGIDLQNINFDVDTVIGIGSELVKVKEEYLPVIDLLLGQVVIVKDRLTVRRLLSRGNWSISPLLRFVTLSGEVFNSNGIILSASTSYDILSRPRHLKELESEIEKTQTILNTHMSKVADANQNLLELHAKEVEIKESYQKALDAQKNSKINVNDLQLTVEKTNHLLEWHHEQVKKIRFELSKLGEEEEQIETVIAKLEEVIKKNRINYLEKSASLEILSVEELKNKLTYWQTQLAVVDQSMIDADTRKKERQATWERARKSIQILQERRSESESELSSVLAKKVSLVDKITKIAQEIDDIQKQIAPTEAKLIEVESTLNQWLTTDVKARQALSTTEHQYAQARINLSRKQEILDSLRRRIEDDFGLVSFEYAQAVSGPTPLPLNGLVEELPEITQIALDLEENVQRQRALLRRIGPVNPEALVEYHEVKERFEFLTDQIADLHKAESDIKEIISELDSLMEREFHTTFEAVAQEFRVIFNRLFGGGMARLVLTDPDDLSDTGIDIEARLPGRREQGLSLLSGGERSLTAAALVFALLRISPTPFCILDEVDAMLDETNVGRFRELLRELSEHTQFIIITHNRNTVQAASIIYGVTMGRDSTSQVISLKLDELTEEFGVNAGV